MKVKSWVLILIAVFMVTVFSAAALASYGTNYHAAGMQPLEQMTPNGEFAVFVQTKEGWSEAGKLAFDRFYRERAIDIGAYLAGTGQARIRLVQKGGGAAHIDAVLLGGRAPVDVSDGKSVLKKISGKDFDVTDAYNKTIDMKFPITGEKRILTLTARVESTTISKVPFQFPLDNLYHQMNEHAVFYSYSFNTRADAKKPFFSEYSLSGSGHPSGYTYGWVSNDNKNLYVRIDFTPDNTMDGQKDYAKVYVQTRTGVREFKVSVPERKWGNASFTYTDRVPYQHKVYEFAIPLQELGITDSKNADEIKLAFAAYGTAAPPPGGAFDPSLNTYLVVYPRAGNIYGQRVNSNGTPVGLEIPISTAIDDQILPVAAYNSTTNQYLVVWQDHRGGADWDIYGQLVNANGTLSGVNFPISATTDEQSSPSAAYSSNANQFLVAWHDDRGGADWDIYGQRVNANGTLAGVNFPISSLANDQLATSIAYNSSTDQFLVVWQDFSGLNWDIYGHLVNADGTLSGANFPIATATGLQLDPSVTYNSATTQYLVVWEDSRGADRDIYGQFVNASGSLSGGDFPVSTAADNQIEPSVAYNSNTDQFLVVWSDFRNIPTWYIFGQYLTGTGALSGGDFSIVDDAQSAHAVANTIVGNYLVAFFDLDPFGYEWVIVGQGRQVAVPTMSGWGIILFILVAGLGAVAVMRRRARTNN